MKKLFTLCFLLTILFNAKAQDLIPFETEGEVGFKNKQGEIVIPAKYSYPDSFNDGLLTTHINGKYGGIDINGRVVVPFKYDNITSFYKGYAAVQLDNTVQIIDVTGKEVKKLKYTILGWDKDDIVNVGLDDKFGRIYIATGQEIIPPIYQGMPRFIYGYGFITRVQLNDKWGFIDKLGNVIVPIEYDEASYSRGKLVASKNQENSYFDKTGEPIAKP